LLFKYLEFEMSKSVLVFGASGVSGWAFVNELLHDYPRPGIWKRIHALTNRPLPPSSSLWPCSPKINLISGIDLLSGSQEDLEAELKIVDGIEEVTHVFYLGERALGYFEGK
jgi:nucleoside-diphosphate-sugar epimerase